MKQCRSCGIHKPLEGFYQRPSKSKRETECISCEKERQRQNKLKKRYGITAQQYDEMYAAQSGCCAICGKHQTQLKKSLAVDHDHKTGQVRGLLCFDCNTGIGKLQDDEQLILNAARYIRAASDRL